MKAQKPEKENPKKPEPRKKELPVEPKQPEITPGPKEVPVHEPEKPEKLPPEISPQIESILQNKSNLL